MSLVPVFFLSLLYPQSSEWWVMNGSLCPLPSALGAIRCACVPLCSTFGRVPVGAHYSLPQPFLVRESLYVRVLLPPSCRFFFFLSLSLVTERTRRRGEGNERGPCAYNSEPPTTANRAILAPAQSGEVPPPCPPPFFPRSLPSSLLSPQLEFSKWKIRLPRIPRVSFLFRRKFQSQSSGELARVLHASRASLSLSQGVRGRGKSEARRLPNRFPR